MKVFQYSVPIQLTKIGAAVYFVVIQFDRGLLRHVRDDNKKDSEKEKRMSRQDLMPNGISFFRDYECS